MSRCFACSIAVLMALTCAALPGQEWGTLTGQFIYDGTPPAPPVPKIVKGPGEKDSAIEFVDESLLVDAKGGLANVVIYVRSKSGDGLAVHPDYEKTAKANAVLEIKNSRFHPHVLAMRTTQPLVFENTDPYLHNVKVDPSSNQSFNEFIPALGSHEQSLPRPEPIPVPVAHNIRPGRAYVAVRPDPYVAVSAADGTFTIANIPTGTHEFVIWHERTGYFKEATIGGAKTALRKGRAFYSRTIKAGPNDLGQIKIDPAIFEKR